MTTTIYWIIDRAKEPSTWAGLAGLALAFGISADEWAAYSQAAAAIAAAVAMFVKERVR
tara:strand:- start:196 stop:372 length:177 start_codon:yes stop_codon:yes gene_type:complete